MSTSKEKMKKKRNSVAAPSGKKTGKVKKSHAERRREKLAAKNAVLPVHKRPIICPPDKAGRHPAFRHLGYVCRALVIWLAVAGVTTFISDAMQFGVSHGYILLVTLLFVTLLSLIRHGTVEALVASAVGIGLAVWKLVTVPRLITDLFYSLLALYNGALERLYRVGYLSYVQYQANIPSPTATEDLQKIGVTLLALLFSVVFTLCLVQRVRLIPPAILSTTLLVVILTFNLYSNTKTDNLGITLVIISFAALLVMSAFDRLYRVKDSKKYDTDFKLFEDTNRPSLPDAYVEEQKVRRAAKDAKKAARKSAHALRRDESVTVGEELSAYFAEKPKKAKKAKTEKKAPPTAQEKAERKKMMKQVRAVRTYDRVTEQAKSAMGGFAAAAALVTFLLVIALPALLVKGNFNTIEAIDEKMAYARDYVTAVLRGDDAALDELEYKADGNNFMSHSTELEQLEFTGKQIFYVMSRYNTNYYMTGWIGTDYKDGAWSAVTDEQLAAYRKLFNVSDSPAETMRYNFYHYMKPSVVDDPAHNDNLLSKYQANLDYGFVNVLFHTRRINSPSSSLFLPSVFASQYGLYDYETVNPSQLTYVDYFDGIRTGRKFKDSKVSYAALIYAPIMTNANWSKNVGALASAYTLQKEALLAMDCLTVNAATGEVTSNLSLTTYAETDAITMLTFTYKRSGEERIWRFYHAADEVKKGNSAITVTTDEGTLTFSMEGSRVVGVSLKGGTDGVDDNLVDQYLNTMTDEARSELMAAILLDRDYSDFVYATYTQKGESALLAELAQKIREQAHRETEVEKREEIPDDPETPDEDESDVIIRYEYVDIPADVSLAAQRNITGTDAFVQRDLLVRNVIDYIITEMGCTYTITPDLSGVDPSMDGVENFLFNTHEGYCVQFASAVALILREYGIPARFCEGYIATGLEKMRGNDFIYGAYVHDYEAHAWVEVWFDGLGWIQYETTPQYYTGMYGTKGTGGGIHTDPIHPDDETQDPLDTLPDEPIADPTDDTETETDAETEDPDNAATLRGAGITFAVLVGLAVIAVLIVTVINKARDAEANRQRIAMTILDEHYGEHTSDSDRRETSREMLTAVTDLLEIFGLSPHPGEFRDEYADRLTAELTSESEDGKRPRRKDGPALPDMHIVMDAMAAEEFGHGMTVEEMKLLATLYFFLRGEIRYYVPLTDRIRLRYFKRKI